MWDVRQWDFVVEKRPYLNTLLLPAVFHFRHHFEENNWKILATALAAMATARNKAYTATIYGVGRGRYSK